MKDLIKAELIKGRHTFSRTSTWLFPILCASLAISLMGGANTQIGIYNWWYQLLLPVVVAMMSIQLVTSDQQLAYLNLLVVPIAKEKLIAAKIWAGILQILGANLLVFGVTGVSGFIFGQQYEVRYGFFALILLTISYMWQLILGMILTLKTKPMITFVSLLVMNIFFGSQDFAGGKLWWIPFAIPARMMAPILKINPNGVALESTSSLNNIGVVYVGSLIMLVLFILFYIFMIWDSKKIGEKI